MLRHDVHPRPTFAGLPAPEGHGAAPVRRSAAPRRAWLLRLLLVPFAAVAAAVAGLVFAVLLPVCGIATIAEGIARASLHVVRDAFAHAPRPRARRI